MLYSMLYIYIYHHASIPIFTSGHPGYALTLSINLEIHLNLIKTIILYIIHTVYTYVSCTRLYNITQLLNNHII